MKLKIIIPTYMPPEKGGIHPRTYENVQHVFNSGLWDVAIRYCTGTYVSYARNGGVSENKTCARVQTEFDADRYLFWDADVFADNDGALEIVKALVDCPHDVACGIYPGRMPDNRDRAICGQWGDRPGLTDGGLCMDSLVGARRLVRVDWPGGGFLMVKPKALATMQYPWFRHEIIYRGEDAIECSEDIGFALNCERHGIPIYALTSPTLKHQAIWEA